MRLQQTKEKYYSSRQAALVGARTIRFRTAGYTATQPHSASRHRRQSSLHVCR